MIAILCYDISPTTPVNNFPCLGFHALLELEATVEAAVDVDDWVPVDVCLRSRCS